LIAVRLKRRVRLERVVTLWSPISIEHSKTPNGDARGIRVSTDRNIQDEIREQAAATAVNAIAVGPRHCSRSIESPVVRTHLFFTPEDHTQDSRAPAHVKTHGQHLSLVVRSCVCVCVCVCVCIRVLTYKNNYVYTHKRTPKHM
jgi:hypothetical protein